MGGETLSIDGETQMDRRTDRETRQMERKMRQKVRQVLLMDGESVDREMNTETQ